MHIQIISISTFRNKYKQKQPVDKCISIESCICALGYVNVYINKSSRRIRLKNKVYEISIMKTKYINKKFKLRFNLDHPI